MEDSLTETLKILLPAALVLYGMYIITKSFLQKEMEKLRQEKAWSIKQKGMEVGLPLKLQAFERMALFLERISPNELFVRLSQPDLSSEDLKHIALHEIKEEFNHNVAQQIYLSPELWNVVKSAKEDIVSTIIQASQAVDPNSSSNDLARVVIQSFLEQESNQLVNAQLMLKQEVSQFI